MFDAYLAARAKREGQPFVPFDPVPTTMRYIDGKLRADGTRSFLASRSISLPEGKPDDPPDAETVNGLSNRKNQMLLDKLEHDGVQVYSGSVRYLDAVRKAGLPRAVVSASANTRQVLAAAKLDDAFDVIVDGVVAGREHLRGKPAPGHVPRCRAVAARRAVVGGRLRRRARWCRSRPRRRLRVRGWCRSRGAAGCVAPARRLRVWSTISPSSSTRHDSASCISRGSLADSGAQAGCQRPCADRSRCSPLPMVTWGCAAISTRANPRGCQARTSTRFTNGDRWRMSSPAMATRSRARRSSTLPTAS